MARAILPGRVGVMLGRLSPRPEGKLQFFPAATWQTEFVTARRLGFECIEWLLLADAAEENPICSEAGRREILRVIDETGMPVSSVCAAYFMTHKLAGVPDPERLHNESTLERVIGWAQEIGATRILLPLLESAALDTEELREQACASLERAALTAQAAGIVLGLEMEIEGSEYAELVRRVGHPNVRAYYDTGNSTAQGFDIATDVLPLLPALEAVHIKDRKRHGKSQLIGAGDTDFSGFFQSLAACGYSGDFVFEHYFDDPERDGARGLAHIRALIAAAREAV